MRRTVKEAPLPPPRLRITTPSNACSRSFSPSMTLTQTLTVSPGRKPPRSFLSSPASTMRIASIIGSLPLVHEVRWHSALAEPIGPLLLFRRQIGRLEQLGPALPCPPDGHQAPPAGDPAVVPGEQDLRHLPVVEHFRPRELRVLEQPARERVLLWR